ncbi:MAG: HigA family addiction module antidote protein [Caldilineaceae bacterium]|nr:HigA family addiction module antidote protein [Caldilineaceae bacterium]
MATKSKSLITIKHHASHRLPTHRPPTHPGEMILEEFLKPLDLTQAELVRRLDVSYPRLNEIVNGRRSVTPDTALRLARVLGMSPDFWLGLQQDWDLWQALNSPAAEEIARLEPISSGT